MNERGEVVDVELRGREVWWGSWQYGNGVYDICMMDRGGGLGYVLYVCFGFGGLVVGFSEW